MLTAPLARADAIICLCGEDGAQRAAVAQQLLIQGAAPKIVLTGGLDGEGKQSAKTLAESLIGKGVSPDRITVDDRAKNTYDQAENVVALAIENKWERLLVVASPYHIARAALTFIRALYLSQADRAIRIIPVTANQTHWYGKPEGVRRTRMALFEAECGKIAAYQDLGHVASYAAGIAHLKKWESA